MWGPKKMGGLFKGKEGDWVPAFGMVMERKKRKGGNGDWAAEVMGDGPL